MEWWKGVIIAVFLLSAGSAVLHVWNYLCQTQPNSPSVSGLGKITLIDTPEMNAWVPSNRIQHHPQPEILALTDYTTNLVLIIQAFTNVFTNYVNLYVDYTNLATNYVWLYSEYTNTLFAPPVLLSQDWEAVRFRIYKSEYELSLYSPRWQFGFAYAPSVSNAVPFELLAGYRIWRGLGVYATLSPGNFAIGAFCQF